jgi:hypothetical protein
MPWTDAAGFRVVGGKLTVSAAEQNLHTAFFSQ